MIDSRTTAQETTPRERRIHLFAAIVGGGMLLALLSCFFMSHYLKRGFPYNTFLVNVDDLFMDFFNVNHDGADLNPYPSQIQYPPFAMLLARCFCFGCDYSSAAQGQYRSPALAVRSTLPGLINYLILAAIFLAFYFTDIYRQIRTGNRPRDFLLAAVIAASFPALFLLDRGNYAMVCYLFLAGFVSCYQRNRFVANLCLALAISCKLHPLLFLVVLAADRRWRDCATVLAWTVALNLGALLFFQGGVWTNLQLFTANLFTHFGGFHDMFLDSALNISFSNLIRIPFMVFRGRPPHLLGTVYPLFVLLLLAGLVYGVCKERLLWKRMLLVVLAMIGLPGLSSDYNLVFLLPVLLLYFQETTEVRGEDYFYLVCAGLLFIPKHYFVLGVGGDPPFYVLTPQAFLTPLLMLVLFLKVVVPRTLPLVLGASGTVVLCAAVVCIWGERIPLRDPLSPPPGLAACQEVSIKGVDGWWVLPEGLKVVGPASVFQQRPVVRLRGLNLTKDYLGGKLPAVKARLVLPNLPPQSIPATLVIEGDEYVLTAKASLPPAAETIPIRVEFSFASWFVPKEVIPGNRDPRHLVLVTPFSLALLPATAMSDAPNPAEEPAE
jgi:hypothetical protein